MIYSMNSLPKFMMFKCSVVQKVRFVICYTTIKIFKEAWWVELTTTICIVREPRWSHEAYIGLDFLPREDKFPTNI